MKWLILPALLLLAACAQPAPPATPTEWVDVVLQTSRSIQIARGATVEVALAPGWPTLATPARVCVAWAQAPSSAVRAAQLVDDGRCPR